MTKFSAALILAACLAAPAARADDKDKPDPWKTFTSKEGKYSVLLPGIPQQQKQPGDPPKGRPNLYIAVAALDTDRVAYVIHGDYPDKAVRDKGAKAFLDAQTKGSVTSLKGKLLSEKTTLTIGKGKYPGREIVLQLPEKGRVYRARIFLVGKRLYQVVVLGPRDYATGKVADRFFDSFKLVE